MKDDLPAHQASYLAAIDYQYNAHRCSASLSSSSSTSNHLPRWIPDIERSQCQLCHLLFDTIQRKHHCRYCCDIFCNSCTKYRIMLPNEYNVREPQRVCQVCYEKLKNKQKQLINHYSNSTRVNNVIVSKQFNLPYSKTLGSEIRKATNTIHQLLNYQDNIIDDKSLRISLLNNAKGIAFLTVLKGGFIFAPRIGTGLVMSRLLDGRLGVILFCTNSDTLDGQHLQLLLQLVSLGVH